MDEDIARIAEQENALVFDSFDLATGWQLGKLLQEMASERELGVAIDVTLASMPVFYAALPGSTPDNAQWIRRKRNVALRYFKSSYAVGLELKSKGKTVADNGLSDVDYASHGGSFPIFVRGTGCVGAVTVSGLPQRDDHNLVVEALCLILAKDLEHLRLP